MANLSRQIFASDWRVATDAYREATQRLYLETTIRLKLHHGFSVVFVSPVTMNHTESATQQLERR